jgi:hypothetical protein
MVNRLHVLTLIRSFRSDSVRTHCASAASTPEIAFVSLMVTITLTFTRMRIFINRSRNFDNLVVETNPQDRAVPRFLAPREHFRPRLRKPAPEGL